VITAAPPGNGGTAPPPLPLFNAIQNTVHFFVEFSVNQIANDAFIKLKSLIIYLQVSRHENF